MRNRVYFFKMSYSLTKDAIAYFSEIFPFGAESAVRIVEYSGKPQTLYRTEYPGKYLRIVGIRYICLCNRQLGVCIFRRTVQHDFVCTNITAQKRHKKRAVMKFHNPFEF